MPLTKWCVRTVALGARWYSPTSTKIVSHGTWYCTLAAVCTQETIRCWATLSKSIYSMSQHRDSTVRAKGVSASQIDCTPNKCQLHRSHRGTAAREKEVNLTHTCSLHQRWIIYSRRRRRPLAEFGFLCGGASVTSFRRESRLGRRKSKLCNAVPYVSARSYQRVTHTGVTVPCTCSVLIDDTDTCMKPLRHRSSIHRRTDA